MSGRSRIVFAGGGHASLHALMHTREMVGQGSEVILVAPERYHYYSGMTPGIVSELYSPRDTRIDVQYLVERSGGRMVKDRVVKIDHANSRVVLQSGDSVAYDALAANLGSYVTPRQFDEESARYVAEAGNIFPLKPVTNLITLHDRLAEYEPGVRPTILVVGGAVGGVEMAANIKVLLNRRKVGARVVLANKHPRLLSEFPARGGELAEDYLRAIGVEVSHDTTVESFNDMVATTSRGEIPFDLMQLSTGFGAPEIYARSGMATGPDGSFWVNEKLQSITDHRILGGGDTVAFRGRSLARVGIYAIRQGPVVYKNLLAMVNGEPLETFEPQKRLLYILNMGDGYGLLLWGKVAFLSRSAWKIKETLDRRFIQPLQYPGMTTDVLVDYIREIMAEEGETIAARGDLRDELAHARHGSGGRGRSG